MFCVRWASVCQAQKMTGKGGISGVKLSLNQLWCERYWAVRCWGIIEQEWSIVCSLSCPQLTSSWWGRRGIPVLSIYHIDHNPLLTLIINSKLTSLESLYRCKLRPQCLHFEGMLTRTESVNPGAQGMSTTDTQPLLVWNICMQCSTGFNCVMKGSIQLLLWRLPKPRNWVTGDRFLPFLHLHPCPYISQPKFFWVTRRGCSGIPWLSGWERKRVIWDRSEQP